MELTSANISAFEEDGFTLVQGGFAPEECDQFVDYMLDLHAGRTTVEGFTPRAPYDWSRLISRNCHHPMGLAWMLDPRLRQPLCTLLGKEPDGVQSMFFYTGSEQRRHQDAFYLPGCMSAWVALQEVGAHNGSIQIQVGSHKGPLMAKEDFHTNYAGEPGPWHGWNQDDACDELFRQNGQPEIAIEASKGDVVFLRWQTDPPWWSHPAGGFLPLQLGMSLHTPYLQPVALRGRPEATRLL